MSTIKDRQSNVQQKIFQISCKEVEINKMKLLLVFLLAVHVIGYSRAKPGNSTLTIPHHLT